MQPIIFLLLLTVFCTRLTAAVFLIDKAEADKINSSLEQIDSRWRKLSVEITSVETMLQEALQHWRRYTASKDVLHGYMKEAERMLEAPPAQQLVIYCFLQKHV
mgnify:FL=1